MFTFKTNPQTPRMSKKRMRTNLINPGPFVHLSSNMPWCRRWGRVQRVVDLLWLGPMWAFTVCSIVVVAMETRGWVVEVVMWQLTTAVRHIVTGLNYTSHIFSLVYNLPNFEPKIMILESLER